MVYGNTGFSWIGNFYVPAAHSVALLITKLMGCKISTSKLRLDAKQIISDPATVEQSSEVASVSCSFLKWGATTSSPNHPQPLTKPSLNRVTPCVSRLHPTTYSPPLVHSTSTYLCTILVYAPCSEAIRLAQKHWSIRARYLMKITVWSSNKSTK